MVIQEMTELDCRATLAAADVARLACARNDQPYIVPIDLHLDGEFLYGCTTLGQHVEWMRRNPLVCVEVDSVVGHGQWRSVVVFGRYEELTDNHEYEASRRIAERLFQRRPMWWEPASVPLASHELRIRVVFRILVVSMTGRRAAADSAPAVAAPAISSETGGIRRLGDVFRRMLRRR